MSWSAAPLSGDRPPGRAHEGAGPRFLSSGRVWLSVYYGSVAKVRVNMTVDPKVLQRAKRVAAQLPGASVSGLVEEALEAFLPTMEAFLRVKDQAKEHQEEAFASLLATQLLGLAGDGVETMRMAKKRGSES